MVTALSLDQSDAIAKWAQRAKLVGRNRQTNQHTSKMVTRSQIPSPVPSTSCRPQNIGSTTASNVWSSAQDTMAKYKILTKRNFVTPHVYDSWRNPSCCRQRTNSLIISSKPRMHGFHVRLSTISCFTCLSGLRPFGRLRTSTAASCLAW